MGAGAMSGLPPGFVLDQQPGGLPPGFVLDEQPGLLSRIGSSIGPEISGAFNENLEAVKGMYGGTAEKGVIQQTLDVGKGLLGFPGMLASPITGAARAIGGHAMADAVHKTGQVIAPELAAKDDPRQMYEEAKGGVDQAMMAMAPRGASPKGLRTMPAQVPTSVDLINDAKGVYQSPAIKSINIPPNDVVSLTGGLQNELLTRGFRPTKGSAPGTFAEIERMTPDPRVMSVGVDDLRAARRAFGETAKNRGPDFKPTTDAAAATSAIHKIDDFLDTLAPELRDANANYAAGKRADMLDYRTIKADKEAAMTGSGSNMENKLRQAVIKIGDRGLSKSEIAARDRIGEGSAGRNALRKVGKLGVSDGLSLLLHAGAATGTGGATLPIAAAGTIARKLGEILTRREIAALSKTMRSRSPLAQALAASPQFAKVPKGAKAIAAALLSQSRDAPVFAGMRPSYAEDNQR